MSSPGSKLIQGWIGRLKPMNYPLALASYLRVLDRGMNLFSYLCVFYQRLKDFGSGVGIIDKRLCDLCDCPSLVCHQSKYEITFLFCMTSKIFSTAFSFRAQANIFLAWPRRSGKEVLSQTICRAESHNQCRLGTSLEHSDPVYSKWLFYRPWSVDRSA